jgi:hypothetical protein
MFFNSIVATLALGAFCTTSVNAVVHDITVGGSAGLVFSPEAIVSGALEHNDMSTMFIELPSLPTSATKSSSTFRYALSLPHNAFLLTNISGKEPLCTTGLLQFYVLHISLADDVKVFARSSLLSEGGWL